MDTSKKAALLSAFVFPGVGQLVQKSYPKAVAFIGTAAVIAYILITQAMAKAFVIVEKVERGEIAPDLMQLMIMVNQSISPQEAQMANWLTMGLIIVWLGSVVDALKTKTEQPAES